MDRDAIIATLAGMMPELRRRYGVRSLGVFGSVARGDAGTSSDVDVLVTLEYGVGLAVFWALRDHLEQAIGRQVDLVEESPLLSGALRASIEKDLLDVA